MEVAGNEGFDSKAANYRSLGEKIESSGADCFAYAGNTANNAVQLFKDVAAANPDAKVLLGSDAVAEPGFTDPKEGGLPADVAKRVTVTAVGLAPEDYPPEGQEFFTDYEKEYGDKQPGQYADLRLRGDVARPRRDQARGRRGRRPRGRASSRSSPPRIARA